MTPAAVTGSGRPDDPLVVPLQAGPAAVDWRYGSTRPAPIPPAVLAALLQPPSLTGWLDDAGAALTASDLSQLLTAACERIPGLGDLMAGRTRSRPDGMP